MHADDTPVPVLDPGRGKTKTGRLWVYVRDDRPAADATPPAVWFRYSPDRKGEQPREHLKDSAASCRPTATPASTACTTTGRVVEAACWAHARRTFYELSTRQALPVAPRRSQRIQALYRDRGRDPRPAAR